jgi:hypothetical protein
MQTSIASRNASLNAQNALLNGGTVEIRTGAEGSIDSAPSGTVLATLSINATAFGASSNGSATANSITATTAAATGTAGHYVAKDSSNNPVRSGNVGGAMTLNSTTFGVGDDVSITGWTSLQPGS